jgi:hypothetical protein
MTNSEITGEAGRSNADRAERARRAVRAYQGQEPDRIAEGEDAAAEVLTDLCCDLRHLCDELGLSIAEAERRGYRHYLEEVVEEGGGTPEQRAVAVLQAAGLPAELEHTGGGCMVCQVIGRDGRVWVTDSEGTPEGTRFLVGVYVGDDDAGKLATCGREDLLVELVRASVEQLGGLPA